MSWTPNFDENCELRPTFEHYDRQENYGLNSLRPKVATLKVDEDTYNQIDVTTLTVDARAALKFEAYRRKLGYPKRETRQWDENREDSEAVEYEISKVIRTAGLEPEPSSNYRPNSKTTSKSAIPLDKLPVPGVKNLFLSPDHFKFENPYFITKAKPELEIKDKSDGGYKSETEVKSSIKSGEGKTHREPTLGAPGEQYVSPRQLYALKARRNR